MASYKPGDYYVQSSGMVMQWDGTSWKTKGQSLAPGGQQAIKSGNQVAPPGASNPVVAEESGIAGSNATPTSSPPDIYKDKITIKPPRVNPSSKEGELLRYPHNFSIASTSDYITFEFYEYTPPFGSGEGEGLSNLGANLTAKDGYDLYNLSGLAKDNKASKDVKPIVMYMPEDLQSQYGSRWGGADFATAAVGAMRIMGGKANIPTLPGNIAGSVKNIVFNEALKQINEYTGSSINLNQMLGSITGTILNPNTEMLYQGQDLRTFSLSFKMTPRTDKEAKVIKQICNTFKKASMPYIGGQAIFGTFKAHNLLKVPLVCQVTFMNGNKVHEYLPQYKLCAISGVEVNYTPDGAYATVGKDGSPVSTQLSVSFKETKILFGNDINIDETGASY